MTYDELNTRQQQYLSGLPMTDELLPCSAASVSVASNTSFRCATGLSLKALMHAEGEKAGDKDEDIGGRVPRCGVTRPSEGCEAVLPGAPGILILHKL